LLAVRVLEALKILEDATLDSKKRDIDTPEVREALDLLDPLCKPNVTDVRAENKDHLVSYLTSIELKSDS
jgi:hypothetical protein